MRKLKDSAKKRKSSARPSGQDFLKNTNFLHDPRHSNQATLPDFFLWFGVTSTDRL